LKMLRSYSVWDCTAAFNPLNQACSATLSAAAVPNSTVCKEQNIVLLSQPNSVFGGAKVMNLGRNVCWTLRGRYGQQPSRAAEITLGVAVRT